MIVLVGNVTRVNIGALNYAQSIGDYVVAMHVSLDEDVKKEKEIEQEFKQNSQTCVSPSFILRIVRLKIPSCVMWI